MKISYVTTSNETVASFRYRIASPGKGLKALGHDVYIGHEAFPDAEVVVFSKHWNRNDYSYALFCKARGQRVIFDICDDHTNTTKAGHYNNMARVADLITVNSPEMQKVIKDAYGRDSEVVADPVVTKPVPFVQKDDFNLCWYGHMANFAGLMEAYNPTSQIPLLLAAPMPPQNFPETMRVPWVHPYQFEPGIIDFFGENCAAALLPYRQDKPAKSANRVLEAINVGMYVLTDEIPSNKGIPGLYYLTDSVSRAKTMYEHTDLTDVMHKAQEHVTKLYSPEVIAKRWEQICLN